MRLSAEIISQSEQRTNPLGEREILLRGLSIPQIEHLAVTRDQFDSIDLTDNLIQKLTNIPKLHRLSSLSLANNVIETVNGKNLNKNVPNLKHLNLNCNRISGLHVVNSIGDGCAMLESLVLIGNPVTSKYSYLYIYINMNTYFNMHMEILHICICNVNSFFYILHVWPWFTPMSYIYYLFFKLVSKNLLYA